MGREKFQRRDISTTVEEENEQASSIPQATWTSNGNCDQEGGQNSPTAGGNTVPDIEEASKSAVHDAMAPLEPEPIAVMTTRTTTCANDNNNSPIPRKIPSRLYTSSTISSNESNERPSSQRSTGCRSRAREEDSIRDIWFNIRQNISTSLRESRPTPPPQQQQVQRPGAVAIRGINAREESNWTNSGYDSDIPPERVNADGDAEVPSQDNKPETLLLEATLVQEQEESPLLTATAESAFSKRCQLMTLLGAVMLGVSGGGIAVAFLTGNSSPGDSNNKILDPSIGIVEGATTTTVPTMSPRSEPTFSSPPKAIESRAELRAAVDRYLVDNSPASSVFQEYGFPIGSWNVSLVTDFSSVFDGDFRNSLAREFNDDISEWDTSVATTMYRMFRGTFRGGPLVSSKIGVYSKRSHSVMSSDAKVHKNSTRHSTNGMCPMSMIWVACFTMPMLLISLLMRGMSVM